MYYILKTGIGKQLPLLEDLYLKNKALEKLFYLDSTTFNWNIVVELFLIYEVWKIMNFAFLLMFDTKGQLISKCLLGVIVSTKKPTKFL